MASDLSAVARRFAWGFGAVGLLIPVLVEAASRFDWMGEFDWVIVVWPWSALLAYSEEASLLVGLVVLAIAVALNVLLYAALGALVGALLGLAARRP